MNNLEQDLKAKAESETKAKLENAGIKIGTKETVFWTSIKERAEKEIEQSKHEIVINEELIKLAERKINEEIK